MEEDLEERFGRKIWKEIWKDDLEERLGQGFDLSCFLLGIESTRHEAKGLGGFSYWLLRVSCYCWHATLSTDQHSVGVALACHLLILLADVLD